jgi:hypothetical protein
MAEEELGPEGESEGEAEVPEGAAILPPLPEELNIHPLLLAVLHAAVFIGGSDETIVHPLAGDEILEQLAGYLQRLSGSELERCRRDMEVLADFATQSGWDEEQVGFFRDFLRDFGVGEG